MPGRADRGGGVDSDERACGRKAQVPLVAAAASDRPGVELPLVAYDDLPAPLRARRPNRTPMNTAAAPTPNNRGVHGTSGVVADSGTTLYAGSTSTICGKSVEFVKLVAVGGVVSVAERCVKV
jgi:hypothetical protein